MSCIGDTDTKCVWSPPGDGVKRAHSENHLLWLSHMEHLQMWFLALIKYEESRIYLNWLCTTCGLGLLTSVQNHHFHKGVCYSLVSNSIMYWYCLLLNFSTAANVNPNENRLFFPINSCMVLWSSQFCLWSGHELTAVCCSCIQVYSTTSLHLSLKCTPCKQKCWESCIQIQIHKKNLLCIQIAKNTMRHPSFLTKRRCTAKVRIQAWNCVCPQCCLEKWAAKVAVSHLCDFLC